MSKDKTYEKRIKIIRLNIVLALFSVGASLSAFMYTTFSWFTFNRSAGTEQNRVKIEANLKVNYEFYIDDSASPLADDQINFNNLIPGQKPRKIKFVATNTGNAPLYLNLSFLEPLVTDETPYIDTLGTYGPVDYYYYLGSQIQVKQVSATVNSAPFVTTTGAGHYLVTTSSINVSKGQDTGVEDEITSFTSLALIDDVLMDIGDVTTVEMVFLFVDNGTNQNVYMEEWPTNGVSSRQISMHLIEAII